MSDVVEGRNAVAELLRSGAPVRRVLVADGVQVSGLAEVERLAASAGVPVERRPRRDLDGMSPRGAHQGVVALTEPFGYASLGGIIGRAEGSERSLVIVLDHVTDPGNLGAVVRSAEVAGAAGVVVAKRRSAAIGPGAWKSSAGALAHVPVAQVTNLARALRELKDAGYWIAGASEHAEELAWDAPLDGRLVLVLGSEDRGLARLTAEACDFLVRLPVAGSVGSLNVAQAASVLAFEWVRRGRA
ncbi:MAG: 23S rRNA (guanosine(2251)-2'-O)-methyltransferase RlmB [Coriobacteriaceae bacterium]|nr:23S rRNA (guanosine(2251)-2'-O)-methyltransferase RlmB [Coriobacteriaceae bacterium]